MEGEIASIQSLLGARSIASLVDLPVMADPEIRMVMNMLTDIWASTYILGDPVLARLISATMVRLSLVHGNMEESAYGYVTHAITVGPVRGDYQVAYEFGTPGAARERALQRPRRRAKIHQQFHAHVNLWRQPMATCIPYAREACRSGLESGDFLYAAYGAGTETWPAMVSTQDLAQFVRDYSPNLALIKKLKAAAFADSVKIILNWARALQGRTRAPLSLSDEGIDESEYVERTAATRSSRPSMPSPSCSSATCSGARRRRWRPPGARGRVHQLSGTIWPVEFDFWNGLALAANYADATRGRASGCAGGDGAKRGGRSRCWRRTAPRTSAARRCCCRPRSSGSRAGHWRRWTGTNRPSDTPSETGMLQHQALANELCARFWLERGQAEVAAVFMVAARRAYARWGATAKVVGPRAPLR